MAGQMKTQETAVVRANRNYRGDYYRIDFEAPTIAGMAAAGQFVDLLPPDAPHLLLRRPFSIYDAEPAEGRITLIYKTIGQGTKVMSGLVPGDRVDLLGPLGHGFPAPAAGQRSLIVAGGYGCAATYMIAKYADSPGVVMLGGRNEIDILCDESFADAGFEVQVSTNDGSRGHQGLVTELLTAQLDALTPGEAPPAIYACGPNPMLKAVGDLVMARGLDASLSVDMHMCCGVGACFTCVVKIKADNQDGWEYIRTCRDGPVFPATTVHWD